MTVEMFISLLLFLSTVSSFITEGIKKLASENIRSYNVLVLVVSLLVGISGTLITYIMLDIVITIKLAIASILMGVAIWLVAMFGYDKIKQLLLQIKGLK